MEGTKLSTKVTLKKWTKEQTDTASNHHGVHPDNLTREHFESINLEPEILEIDHDAQTVTHKTKTYSIADWNELNQYVEEPDGN